MSCSFFRGLWIATSVGMLSCIWGSHPSAAQSNFGHGHAHGHDAPFGHAFSWSAHDPFHAAESRIHLQAELMRAQGHAAIDYAAARNILADAYSKNLDNALKEMTVIWDRKIIKEQKRLELDDVKRIAKMKYLNDRRWVNNRKWEQLKYHPSIARAKIENGEALTFLLDRLGVTIPLFDYQKAASHFETTALSDLKIDTSRLKDVMLKQGALVFAANQDVRERIETWPFLLRWDEFSAVRRDYEEARLDVVEESRNGGQVKVETIEKMQRAFMELANAYYNSEQVEKWLKGTKRYSQRRHAHLFLGRLNNEIRRLQETGDIRPMQDGKVYAPEVDGDNLLGFLCYLKRNGLQFAPPKPGREAVYHELFNMMRALYLTVEDLDDSTQAEKLGELAK